MSTWEEREKWRKQVADYRQKYMPTDIVEKLLDDVDKEYKRGFYDAMARAHAEVEAWAEQQIRISKEKSAEDAPASAAEHEYEAMHVRWANERIKVALESLDHRYDRCAELEAKVRTALNDFRDFDTAVLDKPCTIDALLEDVRKYIVNLENEYKAYRLSESEHEAYRTASIVMNSRPEVSLESAWTIVHLVKYHERRDEINRALDEIFVWVDGCAKAGLVDRVSQALGLIDVREHCEDVLVGFAAATKPLATVFPAFSQNRALFIQNAVEWIATEIGAEAAADIFEQTGNV